MSFEDACRKGDCLALRVVWDKDMWPDDALLQGMSFYNAAAVWRAAEGIRASASKKIEETIDELTFRDKCRKGDLEALKEIHELGRVPYSPLYRSFSDADQPDVALLIVGWGVTDDDLYSSFLQLAKSDCLETLEALIPHVKEKKISHRSFIDDAINCAIRTGKLKAVQALWGIESGNTSQIGAKFANPHTQRANEHKFHLACIYGHIHLMEWFVKEKIVVPAEMNAYSFTPLMVKNLNPNAVKLLREWKAPV